MSTTFPARLHVLMARSAPVGLVLRRGPSKSVCSILWNRTTDEFHVGQWLRGRIYERRSDVSPDGQYLIYFAMNGRGESKTGGAWTAISRTPWLKAMVLLGKGDCWHGGGLFTDQRRYWVNDGYGHIQLRDSSEVSRDTAFAPTAYYGGECPGVYYVRLQRDGWILRSQHAAACGGATVFEKTLPKGWILRKLAHAQVGSPAGKGCYWDEHELWQAESSSSLKCPSWEWAELDGKRLVWAERGCLFARSIKSANKLGDAKLLHDFNGMTFEPIAAR